MRFLRRFSIKTRLIMSFILLSLIPVLISGALIYSKSSITIKEKNEYYTSELLNQITQNIEQEVSRLEYDSIEIMMSDEVQNSLENYDNLSEWDLLMVSETLRNRLVKKYSFLHDVSDVLIYTNTKQKILAYGDKGSNILNYSDELLDSFIKTAREFGGQPIWISTNIDDEIHKVNLIVHEDDFREGVVLVRAIKSIESGKIIGTLIMRTNEEYFSKIFSDMDLNNQQLLILSENGILISSNNPEWRVGEKFHANNLVDKVVTKQIKQGFYDDSIGENIVFYNKIDNARWYIICLNSLGYMMKERSNILTFSVFVAIASAMIAIMLAIYISRSIFVPLSDINHNMTRIQKGDLEVKLNDESKDELAIVALHFNKMVRNVKDLLLQAKEKEREKQLAQFKALQAQVNPHFLSNTLNSVKWLANLQGADNIENLINSLIELLHEAMDNKTIFITVEQEIAYLKHYINIQSFRYYDGFEVVMEIDPDIEQEIIPKFLLQPIVENAILHGFSDDKSRKILIIKAWKQAGRIHFMIEDNGKGMTKGEIDRAVKDTSLKGKGFNGIGIGNVVERISMYYGKNGEFYIESEENKFTRVEIVCGEKGKMNE